MTNPQIPVGTAVLGADGRLLGHVQALYTDNVTGFAAWVAVSDRGHSAVVPLERSRFDGHTLHVPFDAEQVATAPHHDPTTLISYPDGDDLARHYGLIPGRSSDGRTAPSPGGPEQRDRVDHGGITNDRVDGGSDGTGAVVVSEEQLRVGAVNVVVGRARLVTYIVTEDQTFTIPVSRQEVRLVIDPLPADDQVVTGTEPAEETYEVIRHTEQVMFTKQVVPIERVRMVKRVVTTEQALTAQLRSEQIDITHTSTPTTDQNQTGPRQ